LQPQKIAFIGVFDPASRKMVAWNCLIAVLVVEVLFTVSYAVHQNFCSVMYADTRMMPLAFCWLAGFFRGCVCIYYQF
jgi:hypothetical protein